MALLKSILWLVGFTGLGVTLLSVTTNNEISLEERNKHLPGLEHKSERLKKNEQFMRVLQGSAAETKPIYKKTPQEIDSFLKKAN